MTTMNEILLAELQAQLATFQARKIADGDKMNGDIDVLTSQLVAAQAKFTAYQDKTNNDISVMTAQRTETLATYDRLIAQKQAEIDDLTSVMNPG